MGGTVMFCRPTFTFLLRGMSCSCLLPCIDTNTIFISPLNFVSPLIFIIITAIRVIHSLSSHPLFPFLVFLGLCLLPVSPFFFGCIGLLFSKILFAYFIGLLQSFNHSIKHWQLESTKQIQNPMIRQPPLFNKPSHVRLK